MQQLEHWPLSRLIEYARNPRKNDHAVDVVVAAIREFGFQVPILAKRDGTIIDGHLRFKAARKLGLDTVPVLVGNGLTETQIQAFRLSVNKLAELAGWDDELLSLELADLEAAGFDLELTGFGDDEIDALLARAGRDEAPSDDAADELPDTPEQPVSRTGDVWLLGRHRLICGDASEASVITALMDGEQASLCFTSPPYGNQRDYASGGIADWDDLMQGVCARLPMTRDAQVLVNLGLIHRDNEVVPYWDGWLSWMRSQGWRRFAWYVWDQGPGMPGDWNGRLAPAFEFVFHFNRETRRPNKIVPCKHAGEDSHLRADGSSTAMRKKDGEVGGWSHAGQPTQHSRIPDSVIRIMRHKGKIGQDIDHPAVFPVALPEYVMEAFSNPGDVVFEPFNGSGTSLLAAECTGRRCRAVEIAPEYVDVALRRFRQNHPDVTVTLAATGQSFDEVAAGRDAEVEHV